MELTDYIAEDLRADRQEVVRARQTLAQHIRAQRPILTRILHAGSAKSLV